MKQLHGVSLAAVMVALASSAAFGQAVNTTPANVNVLNLLSPFLSLNATAVGQTTLQGNLQQSIATNNSANLTQQQLAISDKNLLGSATNNLSSVGLGTYGAGANLAGGLPAQTPINGITPQQPVGGLGTQLGAIYVAGSQAGLASPLGSFVNLLASAYNYASSDLGVAKNYFANGAATNPSTTPPGYVPVPAVAPAGYTLPTFNGLPNTTNSVLDLAYGVTNTQPGQDVYGSSRPVQVVPNRINQFDPTALSGLSTNPSFPSGHTTYAYTDGLLLAMAVPQQYQSMLLRASEYGNSRIVLGVHYPLDIIGSRALSSYDLAQAFTNPLYINNAATTGAAINLPALFTTGAAQLQTYLSAQCGASVAACAANTANNPYVPSAANQALYQSRLTYGLPTLTFAQAPRELAPTGGPDASILLAPLYGGSTAAAQQIAPAGGLYGNLQTSTINQIIQNTETNALAAFYGTALSYWSRIDLYTAAGYFQNVTGTLALDPADRLTTDVTVGNGGALADNGTITGLATIGAGGLLGGTGRVGSLLVAGGGTLAPGNSIGTLTVTGNAVFAPGSTYQVEVNAAGQSDRTLVGGSAAIQGGTVQVLAGTGTYAQRTGYNILNATGGVSGRFTSVNSNLAFLNPYLTYDPNNVTLTLIRNDVPFSGVAATPNQGSVAGGGIQSLGFGNPVYDAIAQTDAGTARGAFDALSGEIQASQISAQFETAFLLQQSVLDRLRGGWNLQGGLPGFAAGASLPADFAADLPGKRRTAPVPVGGVMDPRVFSLWGQGFGSFGSTSGNGNAGTLTRDTGGFIIGADATIDGIYRFGVAGGFTDTNIDLRARNSSGEITSGFGAVYGGAKFGNVNLRVGGTFAGNSTDTRRNIAFAGLSDSDRGKSSGTTFQGFGEIGYTLPVGPVTFEPFVGGAGIQISQDRFTESGGIAALTILGRDYTVETLTAGLRAEMAFVAGSPFSLRGLLGYRRAFGDIVPTALLSFASGGSQFAVSGVPIDRDALVAEAGIDWKVASNMTLGVSYTGQVGERAEDHGVRGSFLWKF